MKRVFSIEVHGKEHRWSFHFVGDEADLAAWKADGLDVEPVLNAVPRIPAFLCVPFMRVQNAWRWLRLF